MIIALVDRRIHFWLWQLLDQSVQSPRSQWVRGESADVVQSPVPPMQTWLPVFLEPSRNPDPTGLNGDFSAFAGFGEAMMGICDILN